MKRSIPASPSKWTRRNIIWSYTLNLFMPYLLIALLCFHAMGWWAFEPYAIIATAIFIRRFGFRTGYAVAYCEKHGIETDL